MRKKKYKIIKLSSMIFFSLIILVSFSYVRVNAMTVDDITANDIDDNIYDWEESATISPSFKRISNNTEIGYTFGSQSGQPMLIDYSQQYFLNPNIFLRVDGTKIIPAYFSSDLGTTSVFSSLGFSILQDINTSTVNSNKDGLFNYSQNRLRYFTSSNYKKVMTLFDNKFEVEELLYPESNGNIRITLFVKNISNTTLDYGTVFGADTDLNDHDNVSLYSLGYNQGLYMDDGTYRLNTYIKEPFQGYSTQDWNRTSWLKNFNPSPFKSNGQKSSNALDDKPGRTLFSATDSAYTISWPFKKGLLPGKTDQYSFAQGLTDSPHALPSVNVDYKNLDRNDGINDVGNKLSFSVKVSNFGFKSSWADIDLKNLFGSDLIFDKDSLKVLDNNGSEEKNIPTIFDESNNILEIKPKKNLGDNQSYTVSFEATINRSALGKIIQDKVIASGTDFNVQLSNKPSISADDKVDIPVSPDLPRDLSYKFTNFVRNESKGESEFKTETQGKYGDIIDYQLNLNISNNSKNFPGGYFYGKLPEGLELIPDSLKVTYPDSQQKKYSDLSKIPIYSLEANKELFVNFKAKVNNYSSKKIDYNPKVISSSVNDPILKPNISSINPENLLVFVSVPDNIDFGVHTSYDLDGIKNRATTVLNSDGKQSNKDTLVVYNNTLGDNGYHISVSYDNSGDNSIKNDNEKALSDNDNFLLFKQIDTNQWVPITKEGILIQKIPFYNKGLNDLTNNVGSNKWMLKLNNKRFVSPGNYSGKVTWTITDGI